MSRLVKHEIALKLVRAKTQLEKIDRLIGVISEMYSTVLHDEHITAARVILEAEIAYLESELKRSSK